MRIRHADMLMRLLLVIAIAMPVRLSVCGCCGSDTPDATEPTNVRETADRAPSIPSCCSGRAAQPDQAHGIATGPIDSGDRLPGDDAGDDDRAPCDDCNCPLCPAAVHAPIFKPFAENARLAAPVLMGTIRPTAESAEIAAHIRRQKRPPRPVSIHA